MLQKLLMILWLVAIIMLTAACGGSAMVVNGVVPQEYDGVNPEFRENYDMLGGEDVLGPAISPLFTKNDVHYQYTAAALMVRDPNAPQNRVFHLAALGLDMGIAEPPIPEPVDYDGRYVEGHVIHSAFLPLYDRLRGVRYVGRPITEMHYNPDKQRYEQYFENLGMYWMESEGPENVRLLNYGAWKCDASCRKLDRDTALVVLPYRTDEIFQDAVARLGADFTGFAITKAYQTPDSYAEQVFENVVLVSDPEHPSRIMVRPITEGLGIKADPLTLPSGRSGFVFYPIRDGLGYNILQLFMDYIAQHGGIDASGPPITELVQINDNIDRQCFANLCVEVHRQASGASVIRPAQLGFTYKMLPVRPVREQRKDQADSPIPGEAAGDSGQNQELPAPQATVASFSKPQARELTMRVWESYAMLSPNQNQEIGVSLLENNVPMQNVDPYLVLSFPDGQERTYYMFPTGEDGVSMMLLDPIDEPNGSLISYQVCILDLTYEKYCVKDSFLMWQNP